MQFTLAPAVATRADATPALLAMSITGPSPTGLYPSLCQPWKHAHLALSSAGGPHAGQLQLVRGPSAQTSIPLDLFILFESNCMLASSAAGTSLYSQDAAQGEAHQCALLKACLHILLPAGPLLYPCGVTVPAFLTIPAAHGRAESLCIRKRTVQHLLKGLQLAFRALPTWNRWPHTAQDSRYPAPGLSPNSDSRHSQSASKTAQPAVAHLA